MHRNTNGESHQVAFTTAAPFFSVLIQLFDTLLSFIHCNFLLKQNPQRPQVRSKAASVKP